MNELRTENWNGYTIRFVYVNGEWMAVLKDVCDAMGLETWKVRERLQKGLPKREDLLTNNKPKVHQHLSKEVLFRYPLPTNGGPQEMLLVNEIGIYKTVFRSHKPEAENFQDWVYNMLCNLRKATGLEGFEVFRMLDKEHQKRAMKRLRDGLRQPARVDYIKANTIADKAVSSLYGHPEMLKKKGMPPQMLSESGLEKLNFCARVTGLSKGEIVRQGIDRVYQSILEKETDAKKEQ